MQCIKGKIFDVAVDIRRSSPTFGQYCGVELSAENKRMLWVPEGFAHGFVVLSDTAEFLYKTTDYWYPAHERCIRWDDPHLAIDWQIGTPPNVSAKDAQGKTLDEAQCFG
ncbi:MAG: dTDP-4-dehydrorhamnose 3,5-epimerase [Syntrophomonadaceae bacterium]|nr:dTDP-4-dehydrorhamnose 3,5-epimerase [Bacillota bacterium]